MNYIIKDGLELLVNLKINLNEEQSRIFKRKFDYVRERYKEKYGRIDYYGLIKITATTYSFVNNENNHDENLIYEFYKKLKVNPEMMNIITREERIVSFRLHMN
ncbi:MAG: hypothetical protein ABIH65_04245 [Nanoarchaeota archaeon]